MSGRIATDTRHTTAIHPLKSHVSTRSSPNNFTHPSTPAFGASARSRNGLPQLSMRSFPKHPASRGQECGLRLLDPVLDLLLHTSGLLLGLLDSLLGVVEGYSGDLDDADAAQEEVDSRQARHGSISLGNGAYCMDMWGRRGWREWQDIRKSMGKGKLSVGRRGKGERKKLTGSSWA